MADGRRYVIRAAPVPRIDYARELNPEQLAAVTAGCGATLCIAGRRHGQDPHRDLPGRLAIDRGPPNRSSCARSRTARREMLSGSTPSPAESRRPGRVPQYRRRRRSHAVPADTAVSAGGGSRVLGGTPTTRHRPLGATPMARGFGRTSASSTTATPGSWSGLSAPCRR